MRSPQKSVLLAPQLITFGDSNYYLKTDPAGLTLYPAGSNAPIYQLREPVLLAQAVATDPQQVHLVTLKGNGELCYTLASRAGSNQTTVLAKLDVRTTRYGGLFLFPAGKVVHIFYAAAHQAIPDLWHIEHRFWTGSVWKSVRLGNVVHPRQPLYHISVDDHGNLHLLTMTFQGHQSILQANRFHGTFFLWGNPTEALRIPHEVTDLTAIFTPDNIHHVFWVAKTPTAYYDLGWAHRAGASDLSGTWMQAPAALKSFHSPTRSIGCLEVNGGLWLLVAADQETLLFHRGDGWKIVNSQPPTHKSLSIVRKSPHSHYTANWLADATDQRLPAYNHYLGLVLAQSPTIAQPGPVYQVPPAATRTGYQSIPNLQLPPVQAIAAYPSQPAQAMPNYQPQTADYSPPPAPNHQPPTVQIYQPQVPPNFAPQTGPHIPLQTAPNYPLSPQTAPPYQTAPAPHPISPSLPETQAMTKLPQTQSEPAVPDQSAPPAPAYVPRPPDLPLPAYTDQPVLAPYGIHQDQMSLSDTDIDAIQVFATAPKLTEAAGWEIAGAEEEPETAEQFAGGADIVEVSIEDQDFHLADNSLGNKIHADNTGLEAHQMGNPDIHQIMPLITEALSPIVNAIFNLENENQNLSKSLEKLAIGHELTANILTTLEQNFSELSEQSKTSLRKLDQSFDDLRSLKSQVSTLQAKKAILQERLEEQQAELKQLKSNNEKGKWAKWFK